MKRQQGKLLFEQKANGVYEVTLFRKTDKGKSVLKNFQNAESWEHLHDKDCEYIKINKQIEIYVGDFKNGKSPLYNSTKPADTPTYQKKPEATLKTKEVETQVSRRGSQGSGRQEQKSKNPLTGKNLFAEPNSIDYTQLPKDTRESLNINEIDNNSLLINKLVHFYKFNKSTVDLTDTNNGDAVLFRNNIIDNSKNKWHYKLPIYFEKSDNDKIIQSVNERQKKLKEKWGLVSKTFTINGRLIIGLGGASVYETSMTLHHIYGFPYIPASAVKGVLRSWVIQNVFDKDESGETDLKKAEERALKDKKCYFQNIFGTEDSAGKVTFFDAFPTKAPTIKADVMTVHYDKWYSEGKAPTDTMSPNPIPFLTVEDTPFQFLFGAKDFDLSQELWELEINGEMKKGTLLHWLTSALENHGIGAKTAVGYGYMSE